MSRGLGDRADLNAFVNRSQVLWSAALTPAGVITSASSAFVQSVGGPLTGRRLQALVSRPQQPALDQLLAAAEASAWLSAVFAFSVGTAELPVDRLVHVSVHDGAILFIAEPAALDLEQRLTQLLAINEALLASQRLVADQQRELVQARDEAEGALRRLQALEHVSVAASQSDDPGAGLRALLDQACALVGGRRSSLLLVEAATHRLAVGPGGPAGEHARWLKPAEGGIVALAAVTGRAALVPDTSQDARVSPAERDVDRALLAVPLRVADEVVGVLHVGSDTAGRFTGEHLTLLAAVADRATGAIASAQTARRERHLAETFQRSLLPSTLATGALELVAHYLPQAEAADVGGDWYDTIAFDDGCLAICVGDVAGKGVHAAVTMGQVRSAMHALALVHRAPAELLARLDPYVISLGTMITLVYAIYDPASSLLSYASAGHLPMLHRKPSGEVELLEDALSPPLGTGAPSRTQAELRLEPGAQLVLYSDGLVERRGEDLGDSLGRLRRHCARPDVRPADMAGHLLAALVEEPAADDIAVLTAYRPAR
ncbi:MAG: rsbU 2 [Solirubrobacterales bacterium]|nr:rsbU 2 [Solirubrobacterales bacterium]